MPKISPLMAAPPLIFALLVLLAVAYYYRKPKRRDKLVETVSQAVGRAGP